MNENATERVIRRFGGQARFAESLAKFTGVREHKQAAWRWASHDRFPRGKLKAILALCKSDNQPIDHPQLIAELDAADVRRVRRLTA